MECLQTKLRLDVETNDPRTISDFDLWSVLFFKKRTNPVAYKIKCQDIIVNGKSGVFTDHIVLGTEDIDDMTPIYVKRLYGDNTAANHDYPLFADFSVMNPYGNVECNKWNIGIPVKATTEELASYVKRSKGIDTLNVNCEDVTGDIGALSTLTNLTSLGLIRSNVTGDIGALSTLTRLNNLQIQRTNVTGDIGPIIEKCTSLKQLQISTTVTITDEQKKILTDRGCSIRIY